jgi:CRP-like cAMP-binding protein
MSEKKENLAELMLQFPVFNKFNSRDRETLARSAISKKYNKGEYIVHAGEVFPYVLIIESGEIRGIKISTEGRLLETLKIQAGKGFWNPSLFDEKNMSGSVEVWEPSKIYLIHKNVIFPMLKNNPEAMWELNLEFINHLRQKSEMVEDFAFSTISRRLARFLLDQFDGMEDSLISRELSLKEIGATIGTTPIMICKHLSRFTEAGLIVVSRSEFELSNKLGLEKISDSL